MTKREFLRNELLRGVEEKVLGFGFKLTKSDTSFTRKTTYGWNKYSVTFLLNDYGWTIAIGLLIRFNNVEDFFHQGSGFEKKYQKGTPTIGTPVARERRAMDDVEKASGKRPEYRSYNKTEDEKIR